VGTVPLRTKVTEFTFGFIPYLQEAATGPHAKVRTPRLFYFVIHFNIILPSMLETKRGRNYDKYELHSDAICSSDYIMWKWLPNSHRGTVESLRSYQSLSYSRISQHFMKLEDLLPCSEKPPPPLVPILSQINPVHTTPSYLSNSHFNIILAPSK
jgi:hypothetical protein